jgi:ankyrin repeat protein
MVAQEGVTALQAAADKGYLACLRELLDRGAAVNRASNVSMTPGPLCSLQALTTVSRVLQNGWEPLHQAAFSGHLACLRELLDRGAAIDQADEVSRQG